MDNILDAVRITCKALDEHLANDIKVIDIGHLTTISEYFVIADAKNENQMKALQDAVEESLGKAGVNPERIEGSKSDTLDSYGFWRICRSYFFKRRQRVLQYRKNLV